MRIQPVKEKLLLEFNKPKVVRPKKNSTTFKKNISMFTQSAPIETPIKQTLSTSKNSPDQTLPYSIIKSYGNLAPSAIDQTCHSVETCTEKLDVSVENNQIRSYLTESTNDSRTEVTEMEQLLLVTFLSDTIEPEDYNKHDESLTKFPKRTFSEMNDSSFPNVSFEKSSENVINTTDSISGKVSSDNYLSKYFFKCIYSSKKRLLYLCI